MEADRKKLADSTYSLQSHMKEEEEKKKDLSTSLRLTSTANTQLPVMDIAHISWTWMEYRRKVAIYQDLCVLFIKDYSLYMLLSIRQHGIGCMLCSLYLIFAIIWLLNFHKDIQFQIKTIRAVDLEQQECGL